MRTGLLKYEWLEDNTTIDYTKKVIEMSEDKYDGFIYFLETLGLTPRMSLVDIVHDIFDYNDFFLKINNNDGTTAWYCYNVAGELTRFVDGRGNYYDSYELNPSLITNISELKNTLR
jgi:hypothetical protein